MRLDDITTERLIIRSFKPADLDDLFEFLSDEEVLKFEPYKTMTLEETRENLYWRCSTDEMLAIEEKTSGKMIGNIYLGKRDFNSIELECLLNKNFWGKGYEAEAVSAVIDPVFKTGVHRIYSESDVLNEKNWKMLEEVKFEKEAHLKKNIYFWKDENDKPIWKDTLIYSKLNPAEK